MVERNISIEWVERVLWNPELLKEDKDDPELLHALGRIPEYDDRVLLVIYNRTTNPSKIVSVHFDRRYKGKL